MSNAKRNPVFGVFAYVISGILVVAALWIMFNRQYALDVFTNWTFKPQSSINAIADRTGLTDKGTFIFNATRPEVLEKDAFNTSCPRQEAGSPILGCYTSQDRIYMYNVTDTKLDGMKEVTAAHELLHAVWMRSSSDEQARLGELLQNAYKANTSESLKTRMEYYQRTEPGEVVNELHSILGTEVANLGDELEAYYAQFFDRSKVIALHDNYNKVYTQITTRADELFAEMEKLGTAIDETSKTYTATLATVSADTTAFNKRAESGAFASTAQFNRERAALVARSAQLERTRTELNASIATYNAYYEEYQGLSKQLKTLNDGMDSYRTIEEAPAP